MILLVGDHQAAKRRPSDTFALTWLQGGEPCRAVAATGARLDGRAGPVRVLRLAQQRARGAHRAAHRRPGFHTASRNHASLAAEDRTRQHELPASGGPDDARAVADCESADHARPRLAFDQKTRTPI